MPEEEEIRFPDGRIEHPHTRYERKDLNFHWIVGLILGALGFAAAVHYILWVFFSHYGNYQNVAKRSPYPLAPVPAHVLPPEPRLDPLNFKENIPVGDVYTRQLARERRLQSVGRTEAAGYVHIPIDRALDLLADKLPVVARQPAERLSRRANGLVDSGGPNSGRLLRKKPLWFER